MLFILQVLRELTLPLQILR